MLAPGAIRDTSLGMASATPQARSARIPGPVMVLVSALLIAAAVTGAWYVLDRRPRATGIIDLLALDAEYAVMIRDVARDPGRSFLSLISTERGEVWGAMIPAYEPRNQPYTQLTATAGVISVRTSTGGIPYIQVFAAARGAKLGRYALAEARPVPAVMPASAGPGAASPVAPDASSLADQGQSFELVTDAQGTVDLVAVDLERGAPMWRRALGAGPDGPLWLRPRHLLMHTAGRLHVLERATGEPAHIGGVAMSRPCALSDRVYGVDRGLVHVLSLPTGDLPGVLRTTGITAERLGDVCGTHGGRDILTLVTPGGTTALVAVDARTLAVHWRIDIDQPLRVSEPLYQSAPDALTGPLPRFVPMLVGHADPQLIILDLDTGRTARAGTPTPLLRDAHIVHAGGSAYLWAPAGSTLAVLDGATGALTAAVELPGMAPMWPRHLAGGRIWVAREPGDGDDHAWLVLDCHSLDVTAAGLGGEVTPASAGARAIDVRAPFAGALGLP